MSLKIAFIIDPIPSLKPSKDSTLAMIEAAQQLQWEVFVMSIQDLFYNDGCVQCHSQPLKIALEKSEWYQLGEKKLSHINEFDVVMMRKDPPFNMEYIYSTYLLELAQSEGVVVCNDPGAIRDANEKLFTLQFPQCTPAVMVSANNDDLKSFHQQHQDVIFKPLDGMGGTSIFRVKEGDPNINVIIETLTELGTTPIMAQQFIPEISLGDKRILMINGEAVPYALARIPAKGETRGNLAAGGSGVVQPLTEKDQWIANQVGPVLKEKGLIFVGLDVIGNFLTEINVTSPTCIREIQNETQFPIAERLMKEIARLCQK